MFERYVESEMRPAAGRGRKIVIAWSIVMHGVVATALVARSFLRVEEMAMKEAPIYAGPIVSLPPEPPRPGPPQPSTEPNKRTHRPDELVQPSRRPQPTVIDETPLTVPSNEGSAVTDGEGGGGAPGGTGTAPCPAGGCVPGGEAGTGTPEPPPAMVPTNVPPPQPDQWLEQNAPSLPDEVKVRLRGTGEKWIAVLCADVDGRITRIRVIHDIDGAEEAIRTVVEKWRLKPQSIPICFPLTIDYRVE